MKSHAILSFSRLNLVEHLSPGFSLIVEKKVCSFSINNQPRMNVRKSMQLKPHTTLFHVINKFIGI